MAHNFKTTQKIINCLQNRKTALMEEVNSKITFHPIIIEMPEEMKKEEAQRIKEQNKLFFI